MFTASPARSGSFFIATFNATGDLLAHAGLTQSIPDFQDLLDTARARARLDDFGDSAFHATLKRLLRACGEEASLNHFGRFAFSSNTVQLLVNRLRLHESRKRHPAIADEEIRRPVFITGLPRSGTTLLHGLLAQDPANRAPRTWETMNPPPASATVSETCNPWLVKSDRQVRWFHRIAPGFKKIHMVEARAPQECIAITAHTFASAQFHTTYHVPTYQAWLDTYDHAPCFQFHRRFLQHLQFAQPAARWVLKAPAHLFNLDALFAEYPDATVVHTHRDPLAALGSVASLTLALQSVFSNRIDPMAIGQEVSRRWSLGLARALKFRDSCALRDTRFIDVRYDELNRDPLAVVAAIYRRLGWGLSDETRLRMSRYLHDNLKGKHGVHAYRLSDFGLAPERERERYRAYCARFDIAPKAEIPSAS